MEHCLRCSPYLLQVKIYPFPNLWLGCIFWCNAQQEANPVLGYIVSENSSYLLWMCYWQDKKHSFTFHSPCKCCIPWSDDAIIQEERLHETHWGRGVGATPRELAILSIMVQGIRRNSKWEPHLWHKHSLSRNGEVPIYEKRLTPNRVLNFLPCGRFTGKFTGKLLFLESRTEGLCLRRLITGFTS